MGGVRLGGVGAHAPAADRNQAAIFRATDFGLTTAAACAKVSLPLASHDVRPLPPRRRVVA